MDDKRMKAGQKLLDAAAEFWSACQEEGQHGAVQWLQGTDGGLVIFTRSEYRQQLMENIDVLPGVDREHKFGEQMPITDCCRCGDTVEDWQGKGRIDGELAHAQCVLDEQDECGMDDFHN